MDLVRLGQSTLAGSSMPLCWFPIRPAWTPVRCNHRRILPRSRHDRVFNSADYEHLHL
jgi:hypothetical protein